MSHQRRVNSIIKLDYAIKSQEEYDKLDKNTYLPIRQSILRNLMNGPLKNVADLPSIYRALEQRRLAYKKSLGICWKEPTYDKFI